MELLPVPLSSKALQLLTQLLQAYVREGRTAAGLLLLLLLLLRESRCLLGHTLLLGATTHCCRGVGLVLFKGWKQVESNAREVFGPPKLSDTCLFVCLIRSYFKRKDS